MYEDVLYNATEEEHVPLIFFSFSVKMCFGIFNKRVYITWGVWDYNIMYFLNVKKKPLPL